MIASNKLGFVEYVPKMDRKLPKSKRTVFHLRVMDFDQLRHMQKVLNRATGKKSTMNEGAAVDAVFAAVCCGVDNLRDGDGKEVRFEKRSGSASQQFVKRIPFGVKAEIAEEGMRNSGLAGDDLKN